MANKCELCNRHLGFFNTKNICDEEGCHATVCNACLEKSNQNDSKSTWGTCDTCNSVYCGKHYENHPCDSEDEVSEDEESGDVEVSSDDDVSSDNELDITISKDESLVVINQNNSDFQLVVDTVSNYLSKGYIINGMIVDDDNDSEVWLVKKNG